MSRTTWGRLRATLELRDGLCPFSSSVLGSVLLSLVTLRIDFLESIPLSFVSTINLGIPHALAHINLSRVCILRRCHRTNMRLPPKFHLRRSVRHRSRCRFAEYGCPTIQVSNAFPSRISPQRLTCFTAPSWHHPKSVAVLLPSNNSPSPSVS